MMRHPISQLGPYDLLTNAQHITTDMQIVACTASKLSLQQRVCSATSAGTIQALGTNTLLIKRKFGNMC